MKVPGEYLSHVVHVGQIAALLRFDEEVQARKGIQDIESNYLGFTEFSEAWNDGVNEYDPR